MAERAEKEREEEEKRVLSEIGEAMETLMEQVRRIGYKDPVLGEKAYKEVLSRFRRSRKRVYNAQCVKGTFTLPPSWRVRFLAAKEYCRSQGWIKTDKDSEFVGFALKVFISNIIKRLRQEDAALVQEEEESEQSEEESDKSRESEKDNQQ